MEGFKDLGNPTPVELTSWAFSDQKTWIQDWHIIVTRPNLADTLLVLGANPRCRARVLLDLPLSPGR
jgi:hypothetical protein